MWTKYYKKWHPIMAQGFGALHVWRKLNKIIEEVEHNIWWQTKGGNSRF